MAVILLKAESLWQENISKHFAFFTVSIKEFLLTPRHISVTEKRVAESKETLNKINISN